MSRAAAIDPITGRLTSRSARHSTDCWGAPEADRGEEVPRKATRKPDGRNPILGEGNLGDEVKMFARIDSRRNNNSSNSSSTVFQNSLESEITTADDYPEDLRPNGRPGKTRIEQAIRNPIAGSGDFGVEWDPIYGYAGRLRQLPATDSDRLRIRANPLTGDGLASYDISRDLRRAQTAARPPDLLERASNPLTGENCSSYTISEKLNERRVKSGSRPTSGGNPLTGENCVTRESGSSCSVSQTTAISNPLTGDNCATYTYNCAEFKQRPPAVPPADSLRNPLTGTNCQAFTLSVEEKTRVGAAPAQPTDRSNPVTGEGSQQFVLCLGEKRPPPTPSSARGNPLTGDNLASFDVHREQRGGNRC